MTSATRFAAARLAAWLLLAAATQATAAWPERADEAELRVLSWNVAREQLFASPQLSARLLRLVDADVLLLDELPEAASEARLRALLIEADPATRWNIVLGAMGGNHERSAVVSRWPLQPLPAFSRLDYRRAELQRWQRAATGRQRGPLLPRMSAAAALAQVGERDLLLVAFDMQCCGDAPESWEEQRRRREADLLRAAIESSVREQRPDALVVAGDANTVQGAAPIERLRAAALPSPLQVAPARRVRAGSDWTWDGRGTPFPSRRMDYQLFAAPLSVLSARIVDSEELSAAEQARLQLSADSASRLSPHRPLVVDYRFAEPADAD